MKNLKIAGFDIESSFGLYYSFANNTYEASLNREHTPIRLLMASFKEPGKRPVNISRVQFPSYRDFVVAVHKKMLYYDVLYAHNGKKFDLRKMNMFFAEFGLPRIEKYPRNLVDTKNECKREFDLPSNSLKFVLAHFKIGIKLDAGGEERWYRCMEFDGGYENGTAVYPKDWKAMAKYCDGDVVGMEALFELLKDGNWIKWPSHIANIYVPGEGCIWCPNMDHKQMQSRGEHRRKDGWVHQYMCKECGLRNNTVPVLAR